MEQANKDNEPNGQRHDHGLTRRPGPLSESAAMVRCGGRERTALCEGPRTVRKSVLVVAQQIQLRARIARVLHSADGNGEEIATVLYALGCRALWTASICAPAGYSRLGGRAKLRREDSAVGLRPHNPEPRGCT